jgi:hypothetical protein
MKLSNHQIIKLSNWQITFILFFCVQFCTAQNDATSSGNKIEIGLNMGYGMPLAGGDFGKYYGGTGMYDFSLGYKIHSSYSVTLGAGYSLFPLSKLNNYVADKSDRLLVDAPPYTDLVGGNIRFIGFDAELKKTFNINSKTEIGALAGPSFYFLEKSPIDASDSDGTYQILEHYVHEKPFGVNVGGQVNYSLSKAIALDFSLKYKMMFTSFVTDKSIGILAFQVGCVFKL